MTKKDYISFATALRASKPPRPGLQGHSAARQVQWEMDCDVVEAVLKNDEPEKFDAKRWRAFIKKEVQP